VYAASDESPRVFETEWLDRLTRVPWYAVPAFWVPVVSGLVWWGYANGQGLASLAFQFVIGVFVWTLTEYVLHRTVFHWVPDTPWGERMHFFLHGVHHEWHQDPYRLVMPPAAGMIIAGALYAMLSLFAWLVSPLAPPSWKFALFGGLLFGYIIYDLTHYYVHHGRPRSKWFMTLRKHHLAHHHNPKYKDLKFGVSTTFWDHVFGTN
jgi:dihydroceramide fatty acyl 2-hydroxylase